MKTTASKPKLKTITAYCWADGIIGFTRGKVPAGALAIATGPERKLRGIIDVLARHAYDGKTLIVGPVRDAVIKVPWTDPITPAQALAAFSLQVTKRLA